jgi:membrane protein DedA with SNARE-associated domain
VLLTRPLPLLAEATALLGGATGMRLAEFLPAAAAGNLAVALAWSVAGALGRRWGGVETAAIAALLLPAAATWWAWHRRAPVRST